jgi:hypothetical protein
LGTFWLKIEQFWPFEEISIFSNGGHLGYKTVLTDNRLCKLEKRGDEIKKKIFSSETTEPISTKFAEMILGWSSSKIVSPSWIQDGADGHNLKGTHPARFGLIWFSGSRGEDLNVIFYQNMPNLHNRYISTERKISQKNPEYMLNLCLRSHVKKI